MLWKHTKKDTKTLLVSTLLLFSAFAMYLGGSMQSIVTSALHLTANTVGVYAGVEENETNTLVAQLDAREREITARENALRLSTTGSDTRIVLPIFFAGVGLLGLILVNFYLDSRKRVSLAL